MPVSTIVDAVCCSPLGLLNPLDCPHHMRQDDHTPFREGVVLDRPVKQGAKGTKGTKGGSYVDCGMRKGGSYVDCGMRKVTECFASQEVSCSSLVPRPFFFLC